MNYPSLGYLSALGAGLDAPDPFASGAQNAGITPPAPPPAPPAPPPAAQTIADASGLGDLLGKLDPRKLGAPPTAPTMMDGRDSASTTAAPLNIPGVSPPPPPPAAAPAGGPVASPMIPAAGPPPAPEASPDDVQYQPVGGGGVTPAHEAYTRGPMQHEALMSSFEPEGEAATRADLRNQIVSQLAQDEYDRQAAEALHQQEAAQRIQAQRAAELQHLEMDYADQAQKLGQMKLDSNRSWANKSTPEKIGSLLLVAIGGFSALGNGGHNFAYDAALREIDQDVAAQKFDYDVALEQGKMAQSAYAMALQRYGSEDAALAQARAAGLVYASAKANALKAQYGGADSANAADELRAKLDAERLKTLANGFRFIPSQVTAPRYKVAVRGHVLPGTFDEKAAQNIGIEHAIKPAERVDEKIVEGGIQSTLADRKMRGEERLQDKKLAAEAQKEGKDLTVKLPSGEVVTAPSVNEAKDLRDLAAQDLKIRALVTRAKALRKEGFRTSPGNMSELRSIQQQLRTAFSVSARLGALSKDDIKIADGAIGDLADPSISAALLSNPERQLDSYASMVRNDVSNRVKTYSSGAEQAPRATGKMPPGFEKAGKK